MEKISRSLETVEAVHTSNFIEDIKGFKNLSLTYQKGRL